MAEFVSTYAGNKFAHPAFNEISMKFSDEFYHPPPKIKTLSQIFSIILKKSKIVSFVAKLSPFHSTSTFFRQLATTSWFFRCCVVFHSAIKCYMLYHIPASSINITSCNALWIYRSRLRYPSASDFRSYRVQFCPHQKVFVSPANVASCTIHNSIIYTHHNSSSFDTECRYTT